MPQLANIIEDLFSLARHRGEKVEATALRGLHLTARIVDGQRQLLLSRPDVQPSDTEVTTCAKHGNIAAYTVTNGGRWQLITETPELCTHTPGFSGMGDGKDLHFYFGSCITCKARWRREVARRGNGERWIYNGQPVTDWQFALLVKQGPKGDVPNESPDEQAWRELGEKIVERQAAQRQPVVVTQRCETCANGLATEYPNEVECQLGWPAHDRLGTTQDFKTKETLTYVAGHGSLEKPILTPSHGCVARYGDEIAWVGRA
ncbi:hypothetical protein [Deinococcus ruber]|uniref:Uncharacterized protein n=1 Tax=Deinococcus ruber TaxID=1848197 RepID=A0A918FEY1_9DEIO|nr:hypothetical protein [Deinococcus ruber]GGR31232.1 hypothetical protein GCM10008957_47370 [Deinococcus ruber]